MAKIRRTVVVFPVPGGPRRMAERALPPRSVGLMRKASSLTSAYVGISEEGLVAAEKGRVRHRREWRRGSR